MKLYEITNQLAAILEGSDDGEVTPEMEEDLAALEMALELKVEGVLQYRQGLMAERDALKVEAERLKERADRLDRKADGLKTYLLNSLLGAGVGKVTTPMFNVSVGKSPPKVLFEDGAEIPKDYAKEEVVVTLDKIKVLTDAAVGKELPSCLKVVRGVHLRIT